MANYHWHELLRAALQDRGQTDTQFVVNVGAGLGLNARSTSAPGFIRDITAKRFHVYNATPTVKPARDVIIVNDGVSGVD